MRTILSILTLAPLLLSAQYTTPNTGVHWNLDSLVIHSGGAVAAGVNSYSISENLTIAANDSLTVLTTTMSLNAGVLLTFEGYSFIGGIGPILQSADMNNIYEGVRIEETAEAYFDYVRFEGGGGVKCLSGDVLFTHCEFIGVQHIATNNGALEISNGTVEVEECIFQECLGSAISSAANASCGVRIENSVFIGNNTENTNRPQINLGPSGPLFSILISGNMIQGNPALDMVGGIATSSLFGDASYVSIVGNMIITNRYGLTVSGGSLFANLFNNIIEDNDTQNEPLLGGSGINLNGSASSFAALEGNEIRNNLWGVTVQGEFGVDLGSPDDKGGVLGLNTFSNNGNGGQVYALYNNTPNFISAKNNCWIEGQQSSNEEIEAVVTHENDDDGLGFVDFSQASCDIVDGVDEFDGTSLLLYPNPSSDYLMVDLDNDQQFTAIKLYTMDGKSIDFHPVMSDGRIDIQSLAQGRYILELISDDLVKRASFVKE